MPIPDDPKIVVRQVAACWYAAFVLIGDDPNGIEAAGGPSPEAARKQAEDILRYHKAKWIVENQFGLRA